MLYPDFIYGGFTVDNSDGNSEDFPVVLIKVVSLGLFDMTMLSLSDYSRLVEYIDFVEVTSFCISNIAIKDITEATILDRK